jgi:hypothetical protein
MTSEQFIDLLKNALLVLGTLGGAWISQHFANKREASRSAIEQDRLAQENMRWVASRLLRDITTGLKMVGKEAYGLREAVADLRSALGIGMGFSLSEEKRMERMPAAIEALKAADTRYLNVLNEVSVFLREDEDLLFRELLKNARIWAMGVDLRANPEFFKREARTTRSSLRHLSAYAINYPTCWHRNKYSRG